MAAKPLVCSIFPSPFIVAFLLGCTQTLSLWETLPDPRCRCSLGLVLTFGLTPIVLQWDEWLLCVCPPELGASWRRGCGFLSVD